MSRRWLLVAPTVTAMMAGLALTAVTQPSVQAKKLDGCALTTSTRDLNGDGYDDAVVGDPYATVEGRSEAGTVTVLFGSGPLTIGLGGPRRVLTQRDFGETPETGDHFGWAVALGVTGLIGRCAGLAVGAPGEDVDGSVDAGIGHLGAFDRDPEAEPTTFTGSSVDQSAAGGTVEAGDRFGFAVAMTDALADGTRRVAFGAPGEDIGAAQDAGAVNLVRVAASPKAIGELRQGKKLPGSSVKIPAEPQAGDQFGATLAAGRLDLGTRSGKKTDRQQTLIIGAPGDSVSGRVGAGSVTVIREKLDGAIRYTQASTGVPGTAEGGDHFGGAIALGKQIGTTVRQLAVGTPGEDVGTVVDAGAVTVFQEKKHQLAHSSTFNATAERVVGSAEAGDEFGGSLAYFGTGDLAIGIPGKDVGALADAGAVQTVTTYDIPSVGPPLVVGANDPITQQQAGWGPVRANARFGSTLAGLTGVRTTDLVIGQPLVDGGVVFWVNVLDTRCFGDYQDPCPATWKPGVAGIPGSGVRFGQAVA